MSNYPDGLSKAIGILFGYTSKLASDGLDLEDYDEIDACLDQLKELVQVGREELEKAYEDAGGRDQSDRKETA